MHNLERMCEIQIAALFGGRELGMPPEDALVDTLFVRRQDGYVSSALAAFLAAARPAWAQAAE